jgi:ferredoxin
LRRAAQDLAASEQDRLLVRVRASGAARAKAARKGAHMANRITEECINCGACEPECPNQAIAEGADFFEIDAAKCDECAAKGGEHSCKAVCPTECIVQA